jgi:hypothetical protein
VNNCHTVHGLFRLLYLADIRTVVGFTCQMFDWSL